MFAMMGRGFHVCRIQRIDPAVNGRLVPSRAPGLRWSRACRKHRGAYDTAAIPVAMARAVVLRPLVLLSVLAACCAAGGAAEVERESQLPVKFRDLAPLHTQLGRPLPGDWLSRHDEPGQTFRQYLRSHPVRPDRKRKIVYVQPLGDFSPTQRKIIDETARFMGLYFNLPVRVREDVALEPLPKEARRKHPVWGMEQVLTTHILYNMLKPRVPGDGVALVAFTTTDLWPGRGWNYVFGQATLADRVGVWSIHRFGDPDKDEAAYQRCLRRTLKTGTHETGHMFSMLHCTAYECNMCGCNHLPESDRRPLALCPHCLAKVCWLTKADPTRRFQKLATFCQKHGLDTEAAFYRKSLDALRVP